MTRFLLASVVMVGAMLALIVPLGQRSPLAAFDDPLAQPAVTAARAPAGTEQLAVEWAKISPPDLGTMLAAVARPAGTGPFPTILILHGTHGFAQEYVQIAQALAREGFLAVAPCWFTGGAGAGARFITPIACPDAPPLSAHLSPVAMRTVAALVQAVRRMPDVRTDRVALFGHSRGGGIALNHALQATDVHAVVLNSTGYPDEFRDRAAQAQVRVLILHGVADNPADGGSEMTAVQRARDFEAALRRAGKPVDATYYDGGTHNGLFASPTQRDDELRRIVAFLRDQRGQTFRDCADCPEMVVIPAGSFLMGSPDDEPGRRDMEGPQRRVSIRAFAAGKFDVTRGQWAAFAAATNRPTSAGCAWASPARQRRDPNASWQHLDFPQDDTHPVVCVTWNDAQDFACWLTTRTGHTYRLLTEAEWEYAARAGTTTPYPWGSTASHEHANYGADEGFETLAAGRDQWLKTSPVGAFPANAFGLHDMHGNVLQMVQDCLSKYADAPTDGSAYETVVELKNPGPFGGDMTGTNTCSYRMLRGGDWNNPPQHIRSASRNYGPAPGATLDIARSGGVGFRIARTLN